MRLLIFFVFILIIILTVEWHFENIVERASVKRQQKCAEDAKLLFPDGLSLCKP